MSALQQITLIEKETISNLSFKNSIEFEQNPKIKEKLDQAMRLGNTNKCKCLIEFHSDSGPKAVETTVWAAGDNFICLKGGVWIPISKISDIRFV